MRAYGFDVNIMIRNSSFVLQQTLVHGTFATEVHFATFHLNLSMYASKIGSTNLVYAEGTCGGEPFKVGEHRQLYCFGTNVSTDYASLWVHSDEWQVRARSEKVFGHVDGATRRIDVDIRARVSTDQFKLPPDGLIGYSYRFNYPLVGRKDVYSDAEKEMTTVAQAEGAIRGSPDEYIVDEPYGSMRCRDIECRPALLVGGILKAATQAERG